MKEISLDPETLVVESFEVNAGTPEAVGTVHVPQAGPAGAVVAYYTNASERPCSRCCPEW